MTLLLSSRLARARCYNTLCSAPVILRDYQESCIQACLNALASGTTRMGVSLPTGSGKTTIFLSLLARISGRNQATKSLVIVNRTELVQQTAMQAARILPGWEVEIEQGQENVATGQADLTIATYQTLVRNSRLTKFPAQDYKAVIVDEAHHAVSPSYRRLLSHFHNAVAHPNGSQVLIHPYTVPIIGFSATLRREDDRELQEVFDEIVYHRDPLDMIKTGWLSPIRITTVPLALKLEDVTIATSSQSGDRDFDDTSLAEVVDTRDINKFIVHAWQSKVGDRISTLGFCVNVAHVRHLTDAFQAAGVDARCVVSGTKDIERAQLIAEFKARKFPVLLNCAVFTEGTDIPNIDCVLVARPTKSRNLYTQMIGRGLRLSPDTGKKDVQIIDMVDSSGYVPGIVTAPSLFGSASSDVLEVVQPEDPQSKPHPLPDADPLQPEPPEVEMHESSLVPVYSKVQASVDYEDLSALAAETSGAPYLRQFSPNAWIGCGGDTYVLGYEGGYLRIEPIKIDPRGNNKGVTAFPRYRCVFRSPLHKQTRLVQRSATLAQAVKAGDRYMEKIADSHQRLGLRHGAKWRREAATDRQKVLLRGHLGSSKEHISPRALASLSKGEAADLISRLIHGAMTNVRKQTPIKVDTTKTQGAVKSSSLSIASLWNVLGGSSTSEDLNCANIVDTDVLSVLMM